MSDFISVTTRKSCIEVVAFIVSQNGIHLPYKYHRYASDDETLMKRDEYGWKEGVKKLTNLDLSLLIKHQIEKPKI